MSSNVLVFYSRMPCTNITGKTRIGEEIENQDVANALARALILDMGHAYIDGERNYDVVWYFCGSCREIQDEFSVKEYIEQQPGELSIGYIHERMAKQYDKVLIVGSDVPLLSRGMVNEAFLALDSCDVVMAPVDDGGYGMIGSNGFVDMYSDVANWESRSAGYRLADETKEIAARLGKSLQTMPQLFDIDYVADVQRLWEEVTVDGELKDEFVYLSRTFDVIQKNKTLFGIV